MEMMEIVRLSDAPIPVFDCGTAAQNEFIMNRARPAQRDGVSATHVALRGDEMLGYVTLVMSTVRLESHERPSGAIVSAQPTLLVAQLAVAVNAQAQGVGGRLLQFARGVAQSMRHQVGCRYIAVDCDQSRVGFYARHGFSESKGERRKRRDLIKKTEAGAPPPTIRLSRDILNEEWYEADVAPPHQQISELHKAAASDDLEMLRGLLGAGVTPNLPAGRGDDGMGWGVSALHVAAGRGALNAMRVLLAAGAEINGFDGDCETPLHWAARYGQMEAVQLLLRHGAHPSIEGGDGVLTPLDYAVHGKHQQIAALIRVWGGVHSATWEEDSEIDRAGSAGPNTA